MHKQLSFAYAIVSWMQGTIMGSALHTTYCSDQAQEFTSCVHSPALPCSRKTALVFPFSYIRTMHMDFKCELQWSQFSCALHVCHILYTRIHTKKYRLRFKFVRFHENCQPAKLTSLPIFRYTVMMMSGKLRAVLLWLTITIQN